MAGILFFFGFPFQFSAHCCPHHTVACIGPTGVMWVSNNREGVTGVRVGVGWGGGG